jgi:hypothetical protein
MLIRTIAALSLALAAAPAVAQDDARAAREMRDVANSVSGVRIGGGAAADKVVYFRRGERGALVVSGIAALVPGGPLSDVPAESAAALRTRATSSNGGTAPEAADFALARSNAVPLFIVGEWRTPPVLWELQRRSDGSVVWREIAADGTPGAWTAPPP